MRICLASAPTTTGFRNPDRFTDRNVPRIPIGVLSLVAELERGGRSAEVVDLDLAYDAWRRRPRGDFAVHAASLLARNAAELYGLSTICGTYPLTLRIAVALREARPGCRIVLGGPQATATARETLAAFPAVDVVVRGEGERILPALADALSGSGDLSGVAGLDYRTPGGLARTADAPLLEDLDALPRPTYDRHLRGRRYHSLPLEAGRGCPFSCSFCSTTRFFGRRFRQKSPARIVQDMLALRRAHGVRAFDLIHDNFTADRRRVLAFCEAVSSAAGRFTWTCSSRTDTLDDDLIEIMHRAGCRGFFLGVESGSDAIQRATGKRLDLQRARAVIRQLSRRGIQTTLSFMTGFPEETRQDLDRTVSLFVDSLRQDFMEPQITLLSPLAGTPIHARHRDELVYDEVFSDMAFQGDAMHPADRALVLRYPELFSTFYAVPTPWLERTELNELRSFLVHTRLTLRWLLLAAVQLEGDALSAFRAFRAWRRSEGGAARTEGEDLTGGVLQADFLRFAGEELVRRHPDAARPILALARYYRGIPRRARPAPGPASTGGPRRARNVLLTSIGCDGAALIHSLRTAGDLAAVPRHASVLVTRQLPGHDELLRMSRVAAELLRLCDGRRDVRAIAAAFRRRHSSVDGIPAEAAARYGLALLRRRGLVTWPRGNPRAAPARPSAPPRAEGRGRRPSSG